MFKIKPDVSELANLEKEIEQVVQDGVSSAFVSFSANLESEGRRLAATKLKSGLKLWESGFKVSASNTNSVELKVEGLMAEWMESGIQAGEISKTIMNGDRAQHNKAQGKNYVDVPIPVNPDKGVATLGKTGVKIDMANLKSAATAALYEKTIRGKGNRFGTEKRKAMIRRDVSNKIMETTDVSSGVTSHLAIRRVTDNSTWPKSSVPGANILDKLTEYFNNEFPDLVQKIFGGK